MEIFNMFKNKPKKKNPKMNDYFGESKPLKKDVDENVKIIQELLGYSSDIIHREFYIGEEDKTKLSVIFLDGLTNGEYIHSYVMKSLMIDSRTTNLSKETLKNENMFQILKNHSLPISDIEEVSDFKRLCETLLSGDTIILVNGFDKCFSLDLKGWKDRGINEPTSQSVVRGPKDSFNETLRTNTMLIRRRIRDINLRVVDKTVGKVTRTSLAIMYIEGIANDKIVKEVMKRIDRINIDSIIASGYIEQLIIDEPRSMFPTIYTSERPDTAVAGLLEGRIAIVVDGTPNTLLVPALFFEFFQSSEDYYHPPFFGSFMRLIRFLSFGFALLTPAIYVAITTFHQEMLPTEMIISIAAQREGVPFPAFVEALMMELIFEILREAGIRMPRAIGSAISIVGALVLGEAAVNAGFVSSVMVIIVSITAISSLISPSYDFAISIRILRFVFMILGASFGLYGISLGIAALTLHLCSLRSFGIPYMYPLAPFNLSQQKDVFIRANLSKMYERPSLITDLDDQRMDDSMEIKNRKPKK